MRTIWRPDVSCDLTVLKRPIENTSGKKTKDTFPIPRKQLTPRQSGVSI